MNVDLSEEKARLERLEKINLPEGTKVSHYHGRLNVKISNLDEIHEIRRTTGLKLSFQHSFYSLGEVHSTWEDPEGLVTVWYSCYPEDYPNELKKHSKCEWVKETITEETMVLKCEVPND